MKASHPHPYSQYIPPDEQVPAGFTAFSAVTPSVTNSMPPPALSAHGNPTQQPSIANELSPESSNGK